MLLLLIRSLDTLKINVYMKKHFLIILVALLLSGNAYAEWTVTTDKNEFENTKSTYLISEKAYPNKKLNFPYENTEAKIIVGCSKYNEWVYFYFNVINLNYERFNNDRDMIADVSVRANDRTYVIEVYYETGSNFIMVSSLDKKKMLKYISNNNSILVQFDHYGDGKRHYKFNTSNFQNTFNENCN